ncbi:uncharacterized protein N7458_002538 [Penicillium daleae]|uniref:Uncharacterized protein n=1 Tax=Penicillium daleae TaxID=63821 RepID=A0AAD6G6B5_9EURO|nr:uncharacterized protein N7458_002538 [Penicillium daleae]KAJ5460986.1 hypothetical protein N7458_002538 [Penicillium daleae]
MDYEKTIQHISNQQSAPAPLVGVFRRFLSVQETAQIIKQFQSENWIPDGQVLWSGMLREKAQEWADRHRLQTLTTAMGPLMDEKHPDCLKLKKNNRQWSRYVHGASAIFAWRIAQGEKVILLSPPPPKRFHPSGLSYYQLIEEPIIRGLLNQNSVQKIITTHPMIEESEDEEFYYELWPNDKSEKWVERFGSRPYNVKWRQVGHSNDITELRSLMTSSEWHVFSSEQSKHLEKQKAGFIKPTFSILLLSIFLLLQNKLSILILFGLLYSLFDKIGGTNNATSGEKRIIQTAESTSNVIPFKDINTEQDTFKRLGDEIKAKRKAIDKAHQKAIKKLKNEAKAKRKACNKAQKEAARKLKDEAKAEKKACNKAERKAVKKLKNEEKAKRKTLEKSQKEAAKRLRNEEKAKRKALVKAYQNTMKKIKDEETEELSRHSRRV